MLDTRRCPSRRTAATAAALAAVVASAPPVCRGQWNPAGRQCFCVAPVPTSACPIRDDALAADLATWLAPVLAGKARLDELGAREFADALHGRLDYTQQRALAAHAPEHVLVPSGARRALDYTQGEVPVLAVKLQELFGLADGPRVAQDRVAVVLHLLSPRQAPIQVTRDLRSFWTRTYPEVKKELKGRYPRHPWPDDPWSAAPTARSKRRGE